VGGGQRASSAAALFAQHEACIRQDKTSSQLDFILQYPKIDLLKYFASELFF
jgi:hypothetical protein